MGSAGEASGTGSGAGGSTAGGVSGTGTGASVSAMSYGSFDGGRELLERGARYLGRLV